MIIAAEYSFNNGKEEMESKYPEYLKEVRYTIQNANANACKTKKSKEKTMTNKMLFSPVALNNQFKQYFILQGWVSCKVKCDYSNEHYIGGYKPKSIGKTPYRDMDFVKGVVGGCIPKI